MKLANLLLIEFRMRKSKGYHHLSNVLNSWCIIKQEGFVYKTLILGNDLTMGCIYKCDLIAEVYVALIHEVKGNFGLQIVST